MQRSQDKKNKLQAENSRIFHYLQNSLTNISLAVLSFLSYFLLHLYQVFIYGTYALPQLHHFWDNLREEPTSEGFYKTSISSIRLRLQELQGKNKQARKLRAKQPIKDG